MSDDLSKANNLQPAERPADVGPHADGIYFGMPAEEYHADPALGSSAICDLLVSPLRYWIRSPHNPDRIEEEPSEAMDLGTYLHDLLLEGGTKHYIEKPEGMSFATKEGKAWRDMHEDFVIITQKAARTQRTMFQALELSGTRSRFTDGQPEVSVFWTEKSGQRCKIRIDYLKATEALDLKTYANSMDKDTETVIAHTIAARRISVKAFWYDRGLSMMLRMLRENFTKVSTIVHGADDAAHLMLGEMVSTAGVTENPLMLPLYFVFCETGVVPNITARRLVSHDDGEMTAYWRWARQAVEYATQQYARYMAKFGPDRIWIDEVYFKELTDSEMTAARWVLAED